MSKWLVAVIALGLLIRVVLAFATVGQAFDIESFRLVAERLDNDPLQLYQASRWPYPPLFVPYTLVARKIAAVTGLPFHGWIQIPAIVADLGLAVLAHYWLRRNSEGAAVPLAGAALIALGPAFIMISGYHGQIDSLAILPAAIACVLWQAQSRGRAWSCGLLIGIGAAIKTVPILVLVALLPTARGRGEAIRLGAMAVAIPVLALLPWLVTSPRGVLAALGYNGWPGAGGLSLLLQPSLGAAWLIDRPFAPSWLTTVLWDSNTVLVGILIAVVLVILWRVQSPAIEGAVLLWLVVLVFSWTFFHQYVIWLLPFLVLSRRFAASVAVQVGIVVPAVLFYLSPWTWEAVVGTYWVLMAAFWATLVVISVAWFRSSRSMLSSTKVAEAG